MSNCAEMSVANRSREFAEIVSRVACSRANGEEVDCEAGTEEVLEILRHAKDRQASVYLIGNGGSAAVASHAIPDFIKMAGVRASVLHEPSLMTCMSNDFGYENAFAKILETVARSGDVLVAISSSGQSANICNGAQKMREVGGQVISLSGFDADNRLRRLGDINLWLESHDYGYVEIGHLFLLHNWAERLSKSGTP